ncbi:sensor domain-containing diguanylate cyclase [Neobacillus soli]|uniref:sensor domain-containing diguanylate cyclase n=1 Tax=Neobacillus soli TaxID=220688 RepID=UPI000824969B|nr:sensor domain-containing diguanylate cyclase [Neobacillus soli]
MDNHDRNLQMQVNRYKYLLQITKTLHSSLDVEALLGELFVILKEVYPGFSYYILLSQDTHSHSDLPIIDLEYDSENIAAINAYVSGDVQFENSLIDNHAIIYAPLKGHQGVYGVLQVIAANTPEFPGNEVEFITLLAGSAGSALENAQLYQQSRREISDLQLINETAHRLNSNLRLTETMTFMSEQITASFEAQEIGFFLFSHDQAKAKALPGSTSYFFTKHARIYVEYIKEKIQKEIEPLFIGDINLPNINSITSYHSIIAIPIIQSDLLIGFTIVMHEKPYFFSFDTFKLLQSLLHHSSLALTNSMLREELENMIITDHLTKLHSRKFLDEKIQWSMKEDEEGTFILLDIDNFKGINDTYGHQVGDGVLIQVANLIKANIRGNDVGARWGGEELAIYLPRVPLDTGAAIAKRLVEKVSECSVPHITVSCGVSYWHKNRLDSYKYLFKRADEALYYAKETGKDKVVTQGDNIRVS